MTYELEGVLHKVFDTENKTATFQAREFVVKTDGQYPQFIKFQLTQDRCDSIEGYTEGEMIKVYFDLRGREWNEKYFTNLNAWRVEKPTAQAQPVAGQPQVAQAQANPFPTAETPYAESGTKTQAPAAEDFDDLPF